MTITGTCYRCHGTGCITYPALERVLNAVPSEWCSVGDIAITVERDEFHVRTQLRQLLELGYVERRNKGTRGGAHEYRKRADHG